MPSHRGLLRGQLFAGIAFAGLLATGCQQKSVQSNNGPGPDSQLAAVPDPHQPKDATPAPPPGPADALAAKVNTYAQQMGTALEKRQKPITQPEPAAPGDGPIVQAPATPPAPTTRPARREAPVQVIPMPNPVTDAQQSVGNQQLSVESRESEANPHGPVAIAPEDLNKSVATPKPAAAGADMEAKFARHVQEYPRDVWAHLDFQLLHFLRDEQVPQLDALTSLPLEDRELIAAVMDGLTNFRNGLRADNNMLLSRKVKPLLDLAARLSSQAELSIPTLALCTKVDAFGVYEPIEPVRFIAAKEHQAIVYCEVENFSSLPLANKTMWETKLTQEAVLYTESGMPVWVDKAGAILDHSRNRRHDFFIVKKIKLPPTLTIGRYLLKVTVQDQQAKRVAEQTMGVEIVAQMDNAATAAASIDKGK
jgi:hypothetical protein